MSAIQLHFSPFSDIHKIEDKRKLDKAVERD